MKLKVIRANRAGYWYASKIGDAFQVVQICSGIGKYEVRMENGKTGYVDFEDARILEMQSTATETPTEAKEGVR